MREITVRAGRGPVAVQVPDDLAGTPIMVVLTLPGYGSTAATFAPEFFTTSSTTHA